MAEGTGVREVREHAADRAVRHDGLEMGPVRDVHIRVRILGEAPYNGGCNHEPVRDDEPELFKAGEPVLVSDISDREGKLLRGIRRSEPS